MNDVDFWSIINNTMYGSSILGGFGNGASGIALSKGH